ncbi:MAG TPA: serine/threonine-protein phosphatase, partial [Eubacterium sp.]|nr:serine/threonine-protein phosphatase [Eubacterium sp.]
MRFEIAADTDRGIVKETNQDSLLVKCFSTCKGDMAFAVLCDGMGGLSKGELASATVVRAFDRWSDEQLPELCKSSNPDIDSLILERQWDEVIQQQNEKIKAYGKAHAVNMGTTVVALLVTQKAYYIINVGDSRIYSLSDHIERLTTDQTYVQREIMNGNMTQEQAMRDPRRNVLLQCVGASAEVKPEYRTGAMKNGMSLLLCSDGFRHEVSEQEIYEMLK